MTDDRVDELLEDLDRALSIEPSPLVAARVRMRIGPAPIGGWHWLAAAAVVVIMATGALFWRPQTEEPAPSMSIASMSAPESAQPGQAEWPVSSVSWPREALQARTRVSPPSASVIGSREPEVIVRPDQRIAFEQLRAALTDGRLNADSLVAVEWPALPEPLTITPVLIPPFKAGVVAWPNDEDGPLSRVVRND